MRKEQEQKAEQVVPAEAHANAIAAEADGKKRVEITLAEGERQKRILVAEGEKQNLSLTAEGQAHKIIQEGTADADVIRLKGDGEASAIRAKGLAEADAIRAKGLAEAEAMEKKAAAWAKYGEAAIASLIIDALPEIAHEVSIPLLNTEKIIIMGGEGQAGLVNKSADIMAKLPVVVEALTGQSITNLLGNISQSAGKGLHPPSGEGKKGGAGWEAVEEKS
jgi:flotillin